MRRMFWTIVWILFIVFVLYSLATIQYQLNLIMKHLNVKESKAEKVSNEEIEKELEEYQKRL
ncbi:hypothetical protein [Bacillus sp. FJAT-27225]|uniref:hypothetical protein n=1 Tax=Bacillus sp. FJAT-27225 TaxID=1743144 RepID=UPI0011121AD9|nr:hypothetical protein [Bacillus sp. FJAT-27225]